MANEIRGLVNITTGAEVADADTRYVGTAGNQTVAGVKTHTGVVNSITIGATVVPMAGDHFHALGFTGDAYSAYNVDGPGAVDRSFDISQDGIWKWAVGSDSVTSEIMYISQAGVDSAINNVTFSYNGSASFNDCGLVAHKGALNSGPQYFESAQTYLASTYADITAEAASSGGTGFTPVDLDGDYLYFGRDITFNTAFFSMLSGASIQSYCTAEYSTGSGWQATPTLTDSTLGLYRNGSLAWSKGNFSPVWGTQAVNGVTKYWIRISTRWPRKGTASSVSGQLQAPGTNYTTGDVVRIDDGDGSVYLGLTALAGAVSAWAVLTGSTVYSTGAKDTVALSGGGSGLRINVSSVTPSGTGRVRTLNSTPVAAGTGYTAGDRIAIVSGGGTNDAYIRITAVSTGGIVTAFDQTTSQGTNYTAGVKNTINVSVTNPAAAGFTVLLNSVSTSASCYSINPTGSLIHAAYASAGDGVSFFSLDASGRVLISDPGGLQRIGRQLPGLTTARVELTGSASDRSDFLMAVASTAGGIGPQLIFAKSTSTTLETPGGTSDNHMLGAILGYAYSAGSTLSFIEACGIRFYENTAPSGSRAPSRIQFYTTSTTVSNREIFRMNMDGRLIAMTTGYEALVVDSNDIPNRKFVTDYVGTVSTKVPGTTAKNYNSDGTVGDRNFNGGYVYECITTGATGSGRWIRYIAETSGF